MKPQRRSTGAYIDSIRTFKLKREIERRNEAGATCLQGGRIKRQEKGKKAFYLQDCCGGSSVASSSKDVTSIRRPRLGGGEPRLPDSSLVVVCHGTSLALDHHSPAARLCCRNAATSTSDGANVGGDTSFRFPLRSQGRTIFDTCRQHRSVGQNTTMERLGRE